MGLRGVPLIISPDLLQVLAAMGHGDEIVLADCFFPTSSTCRTLSQLATCPREIRADGHPIPALLEAILKLFPLDTYVSHPAAVMEMVPSDKDAGLQVPLWAIYQQILNHSEGKTIHIEKVERFAFYERAKKAYAVVATGETMKYGNIILKKGLVDYSHQK